MDPIISSDVDDFLASHPDQHLPDRIMVLGAAGMLGSYAIEFLCQAAQKTGNHIDIAAVTRSRTKYLSSLGNHFSNILRIVEYEGVQQSLAHNGHWFVIHSASPASPDQYLGREIGLIESNLKLTIEVLEQIAPAKGRMVYFSSGEVYGPTPHLPTREDDFSAFDHLGFRGSYGEAKRAGELIVQTYSNTHSLGGSALRIYHTFGPGINIDQSRIFSTVVKALINKSSILLRTEGSARRSFLYNADLMAAVLMTGFQDKFSAYNVAGETELSIREFADIASLVSNGHSPVVIQGQSRSSDESSSTESPIMRGVADTSRLRSLGWRQTVDVEEAIRRTVQSVQWRQDNNLC